MSVLIIAEAGVNHNGDKKKAFALIDAAAVAGADAVKFQTYNAERLAAISAPKAAYQKQTTDSTESQFEMLKKLELPESWHFELKQHAEEQGITFISTAFDLQSLTFLERLDLPFYKIPSGEITNGPLLKAFARTGKNVILSTGMATAAQAVQSADAGTGPHGDGAGGVAGQGGRDRQAGGRDHEVGGGRQEIPQGS